MCAAWTSSPTLKGAKEAGKYHQQILQFNPT